MNETLWRKNAEMNFTVKIRRRATETDLSFLECVAAAVYFLTEINVELAKKWLNNGAQPTETVRKLLHSVDVL